MQEAHQKISWIESVSNFVRMSFGMITVMVVGYISDKFGRKVALNLMVFGEALHIGFTGLIVLLQLNPWLVIFPGLFEGIFGGGLLSIIAQVAACLADITKLPGYSLEDLRNLRPGELARLKRKRWLLFTIYDGLASFSFAAGSGFGGLLVHRLGFNVAIIICIILFIASAVGVSFHPETHPEVVRRKLAAMQSNVDNKQGSITDIDDDQRSIDFEMDDLITKIKEKFSGMLEAVDTSSPILKVAMALFFAVSVTIMVDLQYIHIYLMGPPFYWNAQTVGLYAGVSDALSSCLSIAFTILIFNWEHNREVEPNNKDKTIEIPEDEDVHLSTMEIRILFIITGIIFAGLSFMFVNKIMMGIAFMFALPTANHIVYGASALRLVKNALIPQIRAIISLVTSKGKQGFVLSLSAFISRVGYLISLTLFPLIYGATVTFFPGTVFFVCAAMVLCTMIFAITLPKGLKQIQASSGAK
ncbi:unnamed protein product [Trichobilharzia szidati]|nr:unnamed protein product [Trichobilharzia szidati]